jgi:hypothetical protein
MWKIGVVSVSGVISRSELRETSAGRIGTCHLVNLAEHQDDRGRLTVVQTGTEIDFEIKRAYFFHHIPKGTKRGSHGHKRLQQLIIAVHGSFTLEIDDGTTQRTFVLDDPSVGLYVGPMLWRDIYDFSADAVGLSLASEPFDESEYYRDYEEFLQDAVTNRPLAA